MRALPAAALLALAAAVPAGAHVTVVPPFAAAGDEVRLELEVPNERTAAPMTGLEVTVPPGMAVRSAEPAGRWRAEAGSRRAAWSGGSLGPRTTARFAVRVVAPATPGTVALQAVQRYADGARVPWRVELAVTPAPAAGEDEQHLGAAALAATVGLAVLAGSLWLLRRLRRRSLQER